MRANMSMEAKEENYSLHPKFLGLHNNLHPVSIAPKKSKNNYLIIYRFGIIFQNLIDKSNFD
jgi:uncharacterized membrane protein YcgQ (UPF0703/DUF1980 family)